MGPRWAVIALALCFAAVSCGHPQVSGTVARHAAQSIATPRPTDTPLPTATDAPTKIHRITRGHKSQRGKNEQHKQHHRLSKNNKPHRSRRAGHRRQHHHYPAKPVFKSISFRNESYQIGDLFGLGTYTATRFPGLAKAALTRARATGVDWVREEFTANDLHLGTRRPYQWWRTDPTVKEESRLGMHILGLLDYNNTFDHRHTNGWMPHWNIKPYIRDYLLYVKVIVRHYQNRIHAWQIWNEPDLHHFWGPRPNPAQYAQLLRSSYQTIKAIDPRATVVMAGPSGADRHAVRFVETVAHDGGRFDVVAIQPYRNVPDLGLLSEVRTLRKLGKPVWFTEMGWAGDGSCWRTCGKPNSQAGRLARLYLVAALGHVARVFWYDLRNDGNGRKFEDHFGLLESNLSAKPAYLAFAESHLFINNAAITGLAHVAPNVDVLRMQKSNHRYYIIWNNSLSPWYGSRFWQGTGPASYLDAYGTIQGSSATDALTVTVPARSVVYVAPSSFETRPPASPAINLAGIRIRNPRLIWPGSNHVGKKKRPHHKPKPKHRKHHPPTPTATPTRKPVEPTPTPTPTRVRPTPTPTRAPTQTSTPTPKPTPKPKPSPTATPTAFPSPSASPTAP